MLNNYVLIVIKTPLLSSMCPTTMEANIAARGLFSKNLYYSGGKKTVIHAFFFVSTTDLQTKLLLLPSH